MVDVSINTVTKLLVDAGQACMAFHDANVLGLVKLYGESAEQGPERKYSPSVCIGTKVHVMNGNPDAEHISTSYVERQNLTMRMHMRRFTRLTNGFSKKFENHVWMVALYTVFYNFVKVHKTLRVTPAMEANLMDRVLTFEDIVMIIETVATKPDRVGLTKRNQRDKICLVQSWLQLPTQ